MPKRRIFASLLLCPYTALWAQNPLPPLPPPMPGSLSQPPDVLLSPPFARPEPLSPPSSAAASRFAHLPAVTLREFRSSVSEISPRGATDMFIAALVKSRRFRVLERSRLADGIAGEKELNQQGLTTGQAGQSQYAGAVYLFEATVSEASVGDRKTGFTLGLAGAAAGQGSTTDSIAIDVRLIDVESGVVVDAVTVRKSLKSVETRVTGVGGALANLATRSRNSSLIDALAPTDDYVNARKDSLDKGLRDAIDEAVSLIAKRTDHEL